MNNKILVKCRKIIFTLCFCIFFSNVVLATGSTYNDPDIAEIMKKNNMQGTMIIASEDNQIIYSYNIKRANTRLSPASTFKIANSIIAIEEGVLKDQNEIIKWDGKKRLLDAWNKDQNLKTAFRSSCVWFYQELAKRIGKDKYLQYLKKLDYGNHLLGKDVTTFWLAGEGADLKITPLEQINFLQRIYQENLPISARSYDVLKDIMLEESTSSYQIYSKTGAAIQNWIGHGWYVGYVTSKGKVWFFATNILINGMKDLPKRKAVTIEVFKSKNII